MSNPASKFLAINLFYVDFMFWHHLQFYSTALLQLFTGRNKNCYFCLVFQLLRWVTCCSTCGVWILKTTCSLFYNNRDYSQESNTMLRKRLLLSGKPSRRSSPALKRPRRPKPRRVSLQSPSSSPLLHPPASSSLQIRLQIQKQTHLLRSSPPT